MSLINATLSAPPGLEGFNVQEKAYEEEELDSSGKATTSANGCTSQDEIEGGSGSESTEKNNSSAGDQEPEKELDPDSSAGGGHLLTYLPTYLEHDTQHYPWAAEQLTNGYCPDLLTGANNWGMPGYDPAAWPQNPFLGAQFDSMYAGASSFQATHGIAARNGNGNSIVQLATAALEAANGKMIDPLEWNNVCTVMMKNLPNQVTQEMLATEINEAGFLHAYDFIYLPIDPETNANRGYAFINFTTPGLALMFKMHFEGRKLANFNSNKVVSVTPAAMQGFDANLVNDWSKKATAATTSTTREGQEAANSPSRAKNRRSQRGGRPKASLIDIAARTCTAQNLSNETREVPTKELAQVALPPPPGILTKETSSCVTKEETSPSVTKKCSKSSSDHDAEGLPKKRSANFCPYCGGSLQAGFKFCRFCGASVTFESS